MLSPDPVTQAPDNGQNYNRYSYAYNNPLKFSDPSGYSSQASRIKGFGRGSGHYDAKAGAEYSLIGSGYGQYSYNVPGETVTVGTSTSYSDIILASTLDSLANSPSSVFGDRADGGGGGAPAKEGELVDIATAGSINCNVDPDSCTAAQNNTGALSININAGWGLGGTLGFNLAWDTSGNVAIQVVTGGGGDTPGASITGNLEITNAQNVEALQGLGAQTGIDGGVAIVVEGGYITGNGYSGVYGGYGFGFGPPVGVSGYVTNTTNIVTINIPVIWSFLWK